MLPLGTDLTYNERYTTTLFLEMNYGETSVGTRVILATCANNPTDNQQLMLKDMSDNGIQPKTIQTFNQNTVIGVKVLKYKAWI